MIVEGVLPVHKPEGYTSHDVVAKVRRILGLKRIGHTGTLDPMVTGVLPLCLGRGTRIVEYIQDLPKSYQADLRIGLATDTEDMSGNIIHNVDHVQINERQVREVISSFLGEIEQIPPMYSALKVKGVKLYELARQGIEIERKSRKVTIYSLDIGEIRLESPYPEVTFSVTCSKGTYIRTLCSDIGKKLGYPAVMSNLIRTMTGSIHLEQCLHLWQIEEAVADGTLSQYIIPTDQAIGHMPAYHLSAGQAELALKGQKIAVDELEPFPSMETSHIRLYSSEGPFLGIFKIEHQQVVPVKVFS